MYAFGFGVGTGLVDGISHARRHTHVLVVCM